MPKKCVINTENVVLCLESLQANDTQFSYKLFRAIKIERKVYANQD